jgi:hypothetical protein
MEHKNIFLASAFFILSGLAVAQGATSGGETLRLTLTFSQILLAILAIGGIAYSSYLFRGGMLAKPMAAVGAGMAVFAFERVWAGLATFGYVPGFSELISSLLYQVAGILIAGGYIYVALVLKN